MFHLSPVTPLVNNSNVHFKEACEKFGVPVKLIYMSPSEFFNEKYLRVYFNRNLLKKKGGGRDNLTPEKFLEKYGKDLGNIAEQCLNGTYRFSYYNEKLLLKGSKKYPRPAS